MYFLAPIEYLFSPKDRAYKTPELLAEAVRQVGGLIRNNHPSAGQVGRDQFAYPPECSSVITNTEIGRDVVFYNRKRYETNVEQTVRGFLDAGGRTGFVAGTDTHEGKPVPRMAVLARELTREAIFEALRRRRNYAVSSARIVLRLTVNGHQIGEKTEVSGLPRISVIVDGTDTIDGVALIRDGVVVHSPPSAMNGASFTWVDSGFYGDSYYYVRVTQADADEHGNPSRAWSSPIWVRAKSRGRSALSADASR